MSLQPKPEASNVDAQGRPLASSSARERPSPVTSNSEDHPGKRGGRHQRKRRLEEEQAKSIATAATMLTIWLLPPTALLTAVRESAPVTGNP